MDLLVVAAAILAFVVIGLEVKGQSYLIEPISVPDSFEKDVQDEDGVAAHLRDAVGLLSQRARDEVAIRPAADEEPSISVTGINLSVRDLATMIRQWAGHPYPIIKGELYVTPGDPAPAQAPAGKAPDRQKQFRLTLRMSNGIKGPFFDGRGEYDDVVRRGALATLHQIAPVTAASALATGGDFKDEAQALAWVTDTLAAGDLKGDELARARLALANIRLAMGQFKDALAAFQQAEDDYAALHRGEEWNRAFDGLATAHLLLADRHWRLGLAAEAGADLRIARAEVKRSKVIRGPAESKPYDSALYHSAQIHDAAARYWFEGGDHPDCAGFDSMKAAEDDYDSLAHQYPAFGYSNHGVLVMQELKWFRTVKHPACGIGPDDLSDQESHLSQRVQGLFGQAVAADEDLPEPWLQGGILLFEQQEPGFALDPPLAEDRGSYLRQSAARLERAAR